MALVWLFPIAWVAFTAFRPIGDTIVNGYVSFPQTLTLDNFISAWNDADLPHFFLNTLIIVDPGLDPDPVRLVDARVRVLTLQLQAEHPAADHVHGRQPAARRRSSSSRSSGLYLMHPRPAAAQ